MHNEIGHRRNPVSSFSFSSSTLNSICRVFFSFLNSLKLYLCNLSFLTFFTSSGCEKRVHIHFISFTTHIARLVPASFGSSVCFHISLESTSFFFCSFAFKRIGELLNIVMICFGFLFFFWSGGNFRV